MPAESARSREYSAWVASIAAVVAAVAAVAAFVLGEGVFGPEVGACTSLAEGRILADFRSGASGWTGWQTTGAPSADDDPASPTGRTLGASFVRSMREASLNAHRDFDLSQYRCLTADVRAAATTSGAANVTAKLYLRVGPSADQQTWHDDGPQAVGSAGQLLRLNLTQIRDRGRTREIGVVFGSLDSSTEPVMIHVDRIEAYR